MKYDPESNIFTSQPVHVGYLPTKNGEPEVLETLHNYAKKLSLDPIEMEIAGFIALTQAPYAVPYTSKDFIVICTANVLYIQQFRPAISLFETPEKRREFISSLSDESYLKIRSDLPNTADALQALHDDPQPNIFRFLTPFEPFKLLNYCMMLSGQGTYRTRAQAGDAIRNIPNSLAVPTMQNYQYVMSFKSFGNAYLQPLASTDGLKFSDGKMYFRGNDMQPVSEVELQNMVTNEGIDSIDLGMLRIFYSIILTEFEKTKCTQIRDVITLYIPDLAESMGLQRNINKQGIQRLIDNVQSFHNIVGVMHGTRNGKPSQSLYPVLNFEGYDDKTNTISFSSPYMNMVIETVYQLAIRMNKNGEPKLTKRGEPVRIPTHSFLVKSSIIKERNKAAVENVLVIVQLIEQCGDNTPHISAATMIERNPQLEKRLDEAKNKTTLLKRTFETTWRILREQTYLEEKYPGISLPDPRDPAAIPTQKNLDSIVFTFAHHGKLKG